MKARLITVCLAVACVCAMALPAVAWATDAEIAPEMPDVEAVQQTQDEVHNLFRQIEDGVPVAEQPAQPQDDLDLLARIGSARIVYLKMDIRTMAQWQYNSSPYVSRYGLNAILTALDAHNGSTTRFADLRSYSGIVSAKDLNQVLNARCSSSSTLLGQGAAFLEAAQTYGINEFYLLYHAAYESAWGRSTLASGYNYNGKTYYNYFGIGAVDSNPTNGGRTYAIQNGWDSPRAAILGGAKWISENYIYRTRDKYVQPTLYHMRWDYERSNDVWGVGSHEYATGVSWDDDIAQMMDKYYAEVGKTPTFSYIVPVYAGQSVPAEFGTGKSPFAAVSYGHFTDTGNSWARDNIERCYELGIMTGNPDGSFDPTGNLTRAQAAQVLYNYLATAEEKQASPATNQTGLTDVRGGEWYTKAVNWAVGKGLVNGYGTTFGPNDKLTREQLCVIVANAATKYKGAAITSTGAKLSAMPDGAVVSNWARTQVAWSLDSGVISGTNINGKLYVAPTFTVDRQTMATVMVNAVSHGVL